MTARTRKSTRTATVKDGTPGPQGLADMLAIGGVPTRTRKAPAEKKAAPAPVLEIEVVDEDIETPDQNEGDEAKFDATQFPTQAQANEVADAIAVAAAQPVDPASLPWHKIAGTDFDPRIVAIREHAAANYNEGGWDIVVETMDTAAIYAVVKPARTVKGAIERMAKEIGVVAEVRAEVQSA